MLLYIRRCIFGVVPMVMYKGRRTSNVLCVLMHVSGCTIDGVVNMMLPRCDCKCDDKRMLLFR